MGSDDAFGVENFNPDNKMYPHLFQRCRHVGTDWHITFIQNGHVDLTSIDGKQKKKHIHLSTIQLIDEFSDCFPEE